MLKLAAAVTKDMSWHLHLISTLVSRKSWSCLQCHLRNIPKHAGSPNVFEPTVKAPIIIGQRAKEQEKITTETNRPAKMVFHLESRRKGNCCKRCPLTHRFRDHLPNWHHGRWFILICSSLRQNVAEQLRQTWILVVSHCGSKVFSVVPTVVQSMMMRYASKDSRANHDTLWFKTQGETNKLLSFIDTSQPLMMVNDGKW